MSVQLGSAEDQSPVFSGSAKGSLAVFELWAAVKGAWLLNVFNSECRGFKVLYSNRSFTAGNCKNSIQSQLIPLNLVFSLRRPLKSNFLGLKSPTDDYGFPQNQVVEVTR